MQPLIKVYKIPDNARGFVGNGLSTDKLDDIANEDLRYIQNIPLYPCIQAKDYENAPSTQNPNESPHYLKVKLTASSSSDDETIFYKNTNWLITNNHPDIKPKIFLQTPKTYFDNEDQVTFQYTYVPKYNELRQENYQISASGYVIFSSDFITACKNGEFLSNSQGAVFSTPNQLGVFAEFYKIQNEGSLSEDFTFITPSGDFCSMVPVLIEAKMPNESTWQAIQGNGVINPSGNTINTDSGLFYWNNYPSGVYLRATGWVHTWDRLYGDERFDLSFYPGEKSPSGIASSNILVKDFTPQYPWYVYRDIKVVNESPETSLEKFCIYPKPRGVTEDGLIKSGFAGLENINQPWDQQEGTALETVGYDGEWNGGSGKTIFTCMAWEVGNGSPAYQNFCQPSGILDDQYIGKRFSFRDKFGLPAYYNQDQIVFSADNPDKTISNNIKYFNGTVADPIGDISFVQSKHVTQTTPRYLWTQPSNPERMILPSGTYSLDGRPRPGTICARLLWTYRSFNQTAGTFSDQFFSNLNETFGEKVFSIQIDGKYYEN